jgi:hypothetical protein
VALRTARIFPDRIDTAGLAHTRQN